MAKKFVLIFIFSFISAIFCLGDAQAASIYESGKFIRTEGKPDIYSAQFSATASTGRLFVENGGLDGELQITSATITLNGQTVFSPNDFKESVPVLDLQISLKEVNYLEIEIASKPGAWLSVKVIEDGTTPPPAPELSFFKAEPASILIGESARLSWQSINATNVEIDNGIGTVATEGFIDVSPTASTVYTITATGPGGVTMAVAELTVIYIQPSITVQAEPVSIKTGEASTLSWASANADTVTVNNNIGNVALNGSMTVTPPATTIYIFTATGPGGAATAEVTVAFIPPPTVSFSANPAAIIAGETSTLSWDAVNADSAVIDQEIGPVQPSGTHNVTPEETTTYTITATGPGGSTTHSVEVKVYRAPEVTLTSTPKSIDIGESATLSWTSKDATTVSIQPDIGETSLNGTVSIAPTAPTTYIVTATGPGGTTTATATVTVILPDPVVTLSVSQQTIAIGESITLTWTSEHAEFCSIAPSPGEVELNGSVTVSPLETTTYTITATGSGKTAIAQVTVTVEAQPGVPFVDFSVTPDTIFQGGSATLTWTTFQANAVHINNGIGMVPINGSITITPSATTEYIITAFGDNTTVNTVATVSVTGNPAPLPEGTFGANYQDLVPRDSTIESYDEKRFSLITGKVNGIDGISIPGVSISILNHPEYGTTTTDSNGQFTIPVEGGKYFSIVYSKLGLIKSHRKVYVEWNEIAIIDPIQMIEEDSLASTIIFDGNPETVSVHRSTPVTDEAGERSLTMIVTGDNKAFMLDEDGNDVRELTTIVTRATEYTTPDSMPAILPPASEYTYCVELSVDGVDNVRFEKPVVLYVDNFLGFEIGTIVPVGYYNRQESAWIPEKNGVVVQLLDKDGDGVVDALDINGDNLPDDIDGDGSYVDDVVGLDNPEQYSPGKTYWRVETFHYSPCDLNWPRFIQRDTKKNIAKTPPVVDQQRQEQKDCEKDINSYVEERSRIFHEDIPVIGTGMNIHYASNRVEGYKTITINVPVTDEEVSSNLEYIIVKLELAGKTLIKTLPAAPNQTVEFYWNGLDHLGRPTIGSIIGRVLIGFAYKGVYAIPANMERSFAQSYGDEFTTIPTRQEVIHWNRSDVSVYSTKDPRLSALELAKGWSLSSHHRLSLAGNNAVLFKGEGTVKNIISDTSIIDIFAGSGNATSSGDGGPAIDAGFTCIDIEADSKGNIYIIDGNGSAIRRIDTEGIISTFLPPYQYNATDLAIDNKDNIYFTDGVKHVYKVDPEGNVSIVAGTTDDSSCNNGGTGGIIGIPLPCDSDTVSTGDGGLAIDAQLSFPWNLEFDAHGSLYVIERYLARIRKIGPDGIISTIAGAGTAGYSGDDGPAIQAQFSPDCRLTIDRDGNIYVTDPYNARIRKIDTSGTIKTIAGTGLFGYPGDGGLAVETNLNFIRDIEVDSSDNLYLSDSTANKILKIYKNGIIDTIAGTGEKQNSGDGGLALEAGIISPNRIAIDKKGDLYVSNYGTPNQIRIIKPQSLLQFTENGNLKIIPDKGIGYTFSPAGIHLSTFDIDTGRMLLEFAYNDNKLVSITDLFGNSVTIQRTADGLPESIVSPEGIVTRLVIDSNKHLTQVTYPDNSAYNFEYTTDGLMTVETEPNGNRFVHHFDDSGRITDVIDQEGGHWQFARIFDNKGVSSNMVTTGEGNVTTYLDQSNWNGSYTSTITGPSGDVTYYYERSNGMYVNKSLACGMDLQFAYDLDTQHNFNYVKSFITMTPAGLVRRQETNVTYTDSNSDNTPDKILQQVTINDRTFIAEHDVLQSRFAFISPEQRVTRSYYAPSTLLTSKIVVPELYETTYAYDSKGRLISSQTNTRQTLFAYNTEGFIQSITDAEGFITSYQYDPVGRVTQVDRSDGTAVAFAYDNNGNMTMLLNPLQIPHEFGFNKVNKNASYITPQSGTYQYIYNTERQLTDTVLPSGKTIQNVYENGQLVHILSPERSVDITYLCSSKIGTIQSNGETIEYEYDGSLVTSEILTGTLNQTLSYQFNNDFNITSFTYAGDSENYSYDNDGLLTGSGAFTVQRNTLNGLPEAVSDGVFNIQRTFNGYGELQTSQSTISGTSLFSWDVQRDNNGRITAKTETENGLSTAYSYSYDSMGRLLSVTGNGALVEEYAYNDNGSRVFQMNSLRGISGQSFEYDDEDHLMRSGDTVYIYDLDGFLKQKAEGTSVTSFEYSSRGELLKATLPDGKIIEYIHDPLGRRIAKKVNGIIAEKYLWAGLTQLLSVYDGSDNLLMRFEYADDRMPLKMTNNGVEYYLAYDQVGSMKVVADSAGNVVKRIQYDTFGNIISDTNSSLKIPFGFAGGLHDRDTGLVLFGYRDYSPEIGRWTAKDPILFAGGDLDLYNYCIADPVNFVDPDGLKYAEVFAVFGAIAGGTITAAGSVVADVFTGGLNILATPGEIAAGSALGGAIGYGVGSFFDWLMDEGEGGPCPNGNKQEKKKPIQSGQEALDQLEGLEKAQKDYREGKRERPIDFVDKSKQRFKHKVKNYKTPQDFYDNFD